MYPARRKKPTKPPVKPKGFLVIPSARPSAKRQSTRTSHPETLDEIRRDTKLAIKAHNLSIRNYGKGDSRETITRHHREYMLKMLRTALAAKKSKQSSK